MYLTLEALNYLSPGRLALLTVGLFDRGLCLHWLKGWSRRLVRRLGTVICWILLTKQGRMSLCGDSFDSEFFRLPSWCCAAWYSSLMRSFTLGRRDFSKSVAFTSYCWLSYDWDKRRQATWLLHCGFSLPPEHISGTDLAASFVRSLTLCREWCRVVDRIAGSTMWRAFSEFEFRARKEPNCKQVTMRKSKQQVLSTPWRKVRHCPWNMVFGCRC